MNKSSLRRKILNLRKSNSNNKIKLNPKKLLSLIKKTKFGSKYIGCYYPSNYEIDDLEIINFFRKKNLHICLPIIKKNQQMDFFEWSENDPLEINKYGIVEPISRKKIIPDIILLPLVAFDKNLNRLGYGGGFYDRYIHKISKIKKVIKIGLSFSYQEVKNLPINIHDQKLDFIFTEKEIIQ